MNDIQTLTIYAILINALVFLIIKFDKQLAIKHKQRIPEKTIWLFSFCGGSLGLLLGMNIFHHKTKKLHFIIGAVLLSIIHSVLYVYLVFHL